MSPIDGQPMKQINRFGIEIDVCASSGGIWLDKGELEKLLAMMREQALHETGAPPAYKTDGKRRDHDDDDDDAYSRHHGGHKQKSKMNRFMDIFDF
jgi:hypothetical protein